MPVLTLPVRHVPPPREHVRVGQPAFRQSMMRLLQRRGRHFRRWQKSLQPICDRFVHPSRIDRAYFGIPVFVDVFAPDDDAEWFHWRKLGEPSRRVQNKSLPRPFRPRPQRGKEYVDSTGFLQ